MFKIILRAIIADAPAKAYILLIKGHTGFYSCTKCQVEGEYLENRVCFSDQAAKLRSHDDFLGHIQEKFHIGKTILEEVPSFDFIKRVPLDYMHLVCLGVMKKILVMWISGKPPNKFSLKTIQDVSQQLSSLHPYIPVEFSRKPRPLEEVGRWKATELRQFLMYTGPIVLRNAFEKSCNDVRFIHFSTLHVAMRILASKNLDHSYEFASDLLKSFVKNFSSLYGPHHVSHNVHGLIHLAEDVKHFGDLESIAAFPFENFMQALKKSIRKFEKPLQQVVLRYEEAINVIATGELSGSDHHLESQCKTVYVNNFILSTKKADKHVA